MRPVRSLVHPAFVLLLASACAGRNGDGSHPRAQSAGPVALPASGLVPTVRPDLSRRVHLMARRPADTAARDLGPIVMSETRSGGSGGFRITQVAPQLAWADTLVTDSTGLVPRSETIHLKSRTIRLEFEGARVRRWDRQADSAPQLADTTFPAPVFAFNQVHTIVRSVPLRVGYSVVLPLYSEITAELEHDTVTVTAAPAGNRNGWTVRFADPAIVATYTLDATSREILDYRIRQRASGTELWWEPADG